MSRRIPCKDQKNAVTKSRTFTATEGYLLMRAVLTSMTLFIFFSVIFINTAKSAEIVPGATCSSKDSDYSDAVQFCKERGMHLLSSRELAIFAETTGAKGIRETAYPGSSTTSPEVEAEAAKMAQEKYFVVTDYENKSFFYYNGEGYRSPLLPEPIYFWSSSKAAYGYVHYLNPWGELDSGRLITDRKRIACCSK